MSSLSLDALKQAATDTGLLVLLRNEDLQHFIIAWEAVGQQACSLEYVTFTSLSEAWEFADVDIDVLAAVTRSFKSDTIKNFESAKHLQLIFPDGTTHPKAKQVIHSILLRELPKKGNTQ